MRLSEKEKKILAALEFNGNDSLRKVAEKTSYRENTLRYYLQRFLELELISYRPLINVRACGFEEYHILFSLSAALQSARGAVAEQLRRRAGVIHVEETSGSYDFLLVMGAESPSALRNSLDELSEEFGGLFQDKEVTLSLSQTLYSRSYIWPFKRKEICFKTRKQAETFKLEASDRAILETLSLDATLSYREMAHRLGMPISTLAFRVKRLEREGLICGWQYDLNTSVLGVQRYKLLLRMLKGGEETLAKVCAFARTQPHVIEAAQCLGPWDYELTVEAENLEQLNKLLENLNEGLRERIATAEIVGLLRKSPANYAGLFRTAQDKGRKAESETEKPVRRAVNY